MCLLLLLLLFRSNLTFMSVLTNYKHHLLTYFTQKVIQSVQTFDNWCIFWDAALKAQIRSRPTLSRGSPACGEGCRQHVKTFLTYNSVQKVAEARVLSHTNPYEICGGQSDTGTTFSPSTFVYPVSSIPSQHSS